MVVNEREIDEYTVAHNELCRCGDMLWRQADFFIVLNTGLLTVLSLVVVYSDVDKLFPMFISSFGVCISVIWLFHGNRIAKYVELTEKCMIKLESKLELDVKIWEFRKKAFEGNNLSLLEKYSSSYMRKTALPMVTIIFWILITLYFTYSLIST